MGKWDFIWNHNIETGNVALRKCLPYHNSATWKYGNVGEKDRIDKAENEENQGKLFYFDFTVCSDETVNVLLA